ncbi:MAG: response regulator [Bacteriovoracaceae bacterium]|jgi:DNA-binding response OmpR family regulator|nr:hypothetical protein [Halobacteriovoraceae bacterium]MDP7321651.1 response regulator [Bacteriovoracaceae bacterium]
MSSKMLLLKDISVKAQQNFLILEDNPDINEMIIEGLKHMGFCGNFYQAFTINDAKKEIQNHNIDYILSDWNLPDGQGVQLLKAVRKSVNFQGLPFVMITANSDVDSMLESSKLGVSAYLVKPFTIEQLQEKVVEGWKHNEATAKEIIKFLKTQLQEKELLIEKLTKENLKLKALIEKSSIA